MEQNKRLFNSLYAVPLHLPALRTASMAPLMQLKSLEQNGERVGDVFSQIAFSSVVHAFTCLSKSSSIALVVKSLLPSRPISFCKQCYFRSSVCSDVSVMFCGDLPLAISEKPSSLKHVLDVCT